MLRSEVVEGVTQGTTITIELYPKSESSTEVKIDADLRFGKLGSALGIFAKGRIKNEIERIIEGFDKSAR